MNMSQLKPAYQCSAQYGVKALAHGGPGSGKTPLVKTAPRPVMCVTEPGLLSLRDWDGPVWEAYTAKAIDEFFDWLKRSNETSNFDTIAVDSVSQMAEIYLAEAEKTNKHGLKAYGDMAEKVTEHTDTLYYLKNKHVYLIAKQQLSSEGGGIVKKRPYFPGKECNVKIPHLYDEILHIGVHNIPGSGEYRAIQTADSLTAAARDRSGKLNEYEPCDLGALFAKCMS